MTTTPIMHKNLAVIGSFIAVLFVFTFSVGAYAAHAATIDTQLDFGSRGQEVTDLQTYLSTNINWYPSQLVTGYFGSLTQGGVQKFQTSEGIVSSGSPATTGYGRVGPTTMAHLNAAMNSGTPQPTASTLFTVPVLSLLSLQRNATSASFSWTTNEPTTGQVYWSTNSIQSDEATGPNQMPYISGALSSDSGSAKTTEHMITLSGLQPNTTYHYVTRSIDASGDITITLDNTFQTTP
ncbi:MAG: fibronectin type III domain-containing protein [Candidatus Pacebacteria bacterium]|nr:fibronectin type III domain-containing protein [Candidatus Paceibacterota bacterium]